MRLCLIQVAYYTVIIKLCGSEPAEASRSRNIYTSMLIKHAQEHLLIVQPTLISRYILRDYIPTR